MNSLQLNPDLFQDPSPHALQTITAGEGFTLSILCPTVSGGVAITTQLHTVTNQRAKICKQNQELWRSLHDLSSNVANELATHLDIGPLQSALRNLSQCVTAPAPSGRPTAPTAPP